MEFDSSVERCCGARLVHFKCTTTTNRSWCCLSNTASYLQAHDSTAVKSSRHDYKAHNVPKGDTFLGTPGCFPPGPGAVFSVCFFCSLCSVVCLLFRLRVLVAPSFLLLRRVLFFPIFLDIN